MVEHPVLVITLDTELIWGLIHGKSRYTDRYRKIVISSEKRYREIVTLLLHTFEKYDIPATWAVIGHAFLDRCDQENGIPHIHMPRCQEDWYVCDPCTDIEKDPLFYGKDIIEQTLSSPVSHEIGYHSFSHVVFSKCTREVAEAEIKEGTRMAKEFGITLRSFVFPKDEVGHLDVLKENGFKIYRDRHSGFYSGEKKFLYRKISGFVDKIVASPSEPKRVADMWSIPGSMKIFDPQIPFSPLLRASIGVRRAIRSKKVFCIFMHPWDFLCSSPLMGDFDRLLRFVSRQRDRGLLHVLTMGDLASHLDSKRKGEEQRSHPQSL